MVRPADCRWMAGFRACGGCCPCSLPGSKRSGSPASSVRSSACQTSNFAPDLPPSLSGHVRVIAAVERDPSRVSQNKSSGFARRQFKIEATVARRRGMCDEVLVDPFDRVADPRPVRHHSEPYVLGHDPECFGPCGRPWRMHQDHGQSSCDQCATVSEDAQKRYEPNEDASCSACR